MSILKIFNLLTLIALILFCVCCTDRTAQTNEKDISNPSDRITGHWKGEHFGSKDPVEMYVSRIDSLMIGKYSIVQEAGSVSEVNFKIEKEDLDGIQVEINPRDEKGTYGNPYGYKFYFDVSKDGNNLRWYMAVKDRCQDLAYFQKVDKKTAP